MGKFRGSWWPPIGGLRKLGPNYSFKGMGSDAALPPFASYIIAYIQGNYLNAVV
jgi:hypothetical protein